MNDNEIIEKPEDLVSVVLTMISKYGLIHTETAFKDFVKDGNVNGFTRINNIRNKMYNLNQMNLQNMLEKMYDDINIDWSVNFFVQHSLKYASNSLESAIKETYDKYGEFQVQEAIKALIIESNINLFTNNPDTRSRDYLALYKVDDTNVKCLINNILGKDLTQDINIYDINKVIEHCAKENGITR